MSVALTKSRCINALKCYYNYALSLFGLVRSTHLPLFVSVEPAAVCQLRCPECPVGMRNGERLSENGDRLATNGERMMSMELFRRVLEEVSETAWVMQFYFQGEPLLNKDLPTMIAEAHAKGLYTIVSTNAQALTPQMAEALVRAGLDRIIVSMDGLSQESYEAYRVGGNIEKAKAAIRYLREAKERLQAGLLIELQCLMLKTNEHEWKAFRQTYKALGADKMTFKTAQLYNYANGHPLMPSNPKVSRYEKGEDGRYHRKRQRKSCLRVWSGAVVTTTGEVLPCCFDKAHAHAYGNIMDTPLAELFANEKAMAFRRAALREAPAICQQCWKKG